MAQGAADTVNQTTGLIHFIPLMRNAVIPPELAVVQFSAAVLECHEGVCTMC